MKKYIFGCKMNTTHLLNFFFRKFLRVLMKPILLPCDKKIQFVPPVPPKNSAQADSSLGVYNK